MTTDTTRLHITPLRPDFLPIILGASLVNSAQNISYHQIQTFPENDYGYVDLPTMDAEKLKKKYNGATLKGSKIKIEDAHQKKRKRVGDGEIVENGEDLSSKKKSKTSKKDRDVLQGYELSPERKVKRGWTEAKENKSKKSAAKTSSQPKSKYSNKDELLFQTQLPPNRVELDEKTKKKDKKRSSAHIVHEFKKNTAQPSFLKDNTTSGSQEELHYEDGKGWVNGQGHIIEVESEKSSRKRKFVTEPKKSKGTGRVRAKPVPEISVSSPVNNGDVDDDTSSSGHEDSTSSGTSDESEVETEDEQLERPQSFDEEGIAAEDHPELSTKEVHPLEALFKKPSKPSTQDIAKPSLEISTTFSFFDEGTTGDVEENNVPGTPFSSQDVRMRGLRSAAPTPDTAHPSRFNSFGSTGLPGDEEPEGSEDDQLVNDHRTKKEGTPLEGKGNKNNNVSEFEKQFWEQRGNNNRAWKERRRTVLKEKRQRENRARRPKNW